MSLTGPYILPLLVALAGFAMLWPLSLLRKDVSLVDLVWGPGFLVQLVIALAVANSISGHGWLLLGVVGLWSARLSVVLTGRRLREGHEDPRYTAIRESWGPPFWWKSLFIVFVLQACLQWLIVLGPISGALAPAQDLSSLAILGAIVAVIGIGLETLADAQLDRFKRVAKPGDLLTSGLRAYMRHPNFTGEIVFWTGVAAIALDAGAWLGLISPVLITFFLVRVSGAPMLDERLSATRPSYGAYRARVPAFVPSLWSRQASEHQ